MSCGQEDGQEGSLLAGRGVQEWYQGSDIVPKTWSWAGVSLVKGENRVREKVLCVEKSASSALEASNRLVYPESGEWGWEWH